MDKTNAGFTIIEVILFVAISGMLLVGAFVAMRSGISNAQFNDTTDTTQSYFQGQYFEVATGINNRSDNLQCSPSTGVISTGASSQPGVSQCVILGRLFQFTANSSVITSRYLSSVIPSNLGSVDDLSAFAAGGYQVRVSTDMVPQLKGEFELPWSAVVKSVKKREGVATTDIQSMAILRSPVSEQMMVYAFPSSTPAVADFAQASNLIANNRNLIVCMASDSGILAKKAVLIVHPGQGQDLFEVSRGESVGTYCP